MDWLRLTDRTCVVTGAASGIGRAVALALAEVGANLVLLDLDAAKAADVCQEIEGMGRKAWAFKCDTSNEDEVRAAAASARSAAGPAYGLINNAGILRPGDLEDIDYETWRRLLDVDLNGYFLCARAFGADMLKAGSGSIIHVSSIAGTNAQPRSGSYSTAKAGVIALGKQMAVEWGPKGVRSNIISPGLIRTPLSESFYTTPGVTEKRSAAIPNRRIGTAEDIANAAVFLSSPRCDYINGVNLLVDGGFQNVLMQLVPRPGFD